MCAYPRPVLVVSDVLDCVRQYSDATHPAKTPASAGMKRKIQPSKEEDEKKQDPILEGNSGKGTVAHNLTYLLRTISRFFSSASKLMNLSLSSLDMATLDIARTVMVRTGTWP